MRIVHRRTCRYIGNQIYIQILRQLVSKSDEYRPMENQTDTHIHTYTQMDIRPNGYIEI